MVSLPDSRKRKELESLTKFPCCPAACQLGNSARSGTLITVWVCGDLRDHILFTNMNTKEQHS